MSKGKSFTLILIAIGIVSIIYYKKFGGSICLFYNFYGISCPTCGMTRAYTQLLKLDFKKAIYYHPLFWTVPFIAIFYNKKKYLYILFAIFLSVWLVRMYLYFNIREPFILNKNAVVFKVYRIFTK